MCIDDQHHRTPIEIARVKSRLKRGPRMTRQMRADYALAQISARPRQLAPKVAAKLKTELMRLAGSGNPRTAKLVETMFSRYAEMRGR